MGVILPCAAGKYKIYERTNEINRLLITGLLIRKRVRGKLSDPALEAAAGKNPGNFQPCGSG
jgi:hypothetical protein